MTTDKPLQQVFSRALAIDDHAQRQAYLTEACGADSMLREQVDKLLKAYVDASSYLESPVGKFPLDEFTRHGFEKPGAMVGPYRLLEKIGVGGFGLVFRAEQQRPVQRQVALKLIKPGMDTGDVIRRFNSERQALALMNHPSIATILDVGATRNGRPFFVMELVEGEPVTDYCDRHRLDISERLDLFMQICAAVQHAHQKGVIHRDLKPANILVADQDGIPVPKIIDFGIARAMRQDLNDDLMRTQGDQPMGTLLYMSPEQATSGSREMDARSDIYSLGVLLYELLSGSTPITHEDVRELGFEEVTRRIREQDFSGPASRISLSCNRDAEGAKNRNTEIRRWVERVAGDLDWIVIKAIDKDPDQRYDSASAFGRDIQRHLANDPVEARPPTTSYIIRKFVRKNRKSVVTAIAFSIVLISTTAFSTWQAIKATHNETIASMALTAEEKALDRAEEALRSEFVKRKAFESMWDFVFDMLRSPDPFRDGRKVTVAELLDRKVLNLEERFAGDPYTRASMMLVTGDTFSVLGLMDKATPLLEKAMDIQTRLLGESHRDTRVCMYLLATHLGRTGDLDQAFRMAEKLVRYETNDFQSHWHNVRAKTLLAHILYLQNHFDESIGLLEPVLETSISELGTASDLTLISMQLLAANLDAIGNTRKALSIRQELVKRTSETQGADSPAALMRLQGLSQSLVQAGRVEDASSLSRRMLDLGREVFGEDDLVFNDILVHAAFVEGEAGRYTTAIEYYEEALLLRSRFYPDDHTTILTLKRNLAAMYGRQGQNSKSLALFGQLYPIAMKKLGEADPVTLSIAHHLARQHSFAGSPEKTVPLLEETVQLAKQHLGIGNPVTIDYMNSLARGFELAGRNDESLKLFRETFQRQKDQLGADHPGTLHTMNNLGRLLTKNGMKIKGKQLMETSFERQRSLLGEDHPDVWKTGYEMVLMYERMGSIEKATRLCEQVLSNQTEILGHDHAETTQVANTLELLKRVDRPARSIAEPLAKSDATTPSSTRPEVRAWYCLQNERFEEAKSLYGDLVKTSTRIHGPENETTLGFVNNLAQCEFGLGQYDSAIHRFKSLVEIQSRLLGSDHPMVNLQQGNLAKACLKAGRTDEALTTCELFVDGARKRLSLDRDQFAGLLAIVGNDLLVHGHWNMSARYLEESLRLQMQLNQKPWIVANTQSMLGEALLGQAKEQPANEQQKQLFETAAQLLLDGWQGLDHVGADVPATLLKPRQIQATRRLVHFYQLQNDEAKVHEWTTRLNQMTK